METSYSVIDMLSMQSPVLAQTQTAGIPVHYTGCLPYCKEFTAFIAAVVL